MKDLNNIQQLWSIHEKKLLQQWNINVDLLRKINIDKIERKMNRFIRIKVITLGFYILVAFLFIGFVGSSWPDPYLVISGFLLSLWAFSICYTSMQELKMSLAIDYADTVPGLQKHLLKLRSNIINFLRIVVWVLPLHLAFVIVFFDLVFGIHIVQVGNQTWLITQLLISVIVMIPLAIWLHKKLVPENADKKWMYNLLRGNGSQIIDSIQILEEIRNAERGD